MSTKQGCERATITAKCKIFMNCGKTFMAVKTNMIGK